MFNTKDWQTLSLYTALGVSVALTAHTVFIEGTYGYSTIRSNPEVHFHIDPTSSTAVDHIYASNNYVMTTQTWRIGSTYEWTSSSS